MITANLTADDREFEYLMIFLDIKIDLSVFTAKYNSKIDSSKMQPNQSNTMEEEVQFNIKVPQEIIQFE